LIYFFKLSVKPKDLRKRLIEYGVFKIYFISLPVSGVSCFVFNHVHGWSSHFSLSQTFGETRVTNSQDTRSDPWEVSAKLVICSRSVEGSIHCN